LFDYPRLEPLLDQLPRGEHADLLKQVIVVDLVKGRGQVRVHDPQPFGVLAAGGVEDRFDRVMAAPARPEPVGFWFKLRFPFWFQRVDHPSLQDPVNDHRDADRAPLARSLGYIHSPDRPRPPRRALAVEPDRQFRLLL
jgi:hypothetical protein